jgi:hypothetical protein
LIAATRDREAFGEVVTMFGAASRRISMLLMVLLLGALHPAATPASAVPPACGGGARAVPHRAGGVAVNPRTVPPGPRACLYRTGHPSWEPTIALTREGWILEAGDGGPSPQLVVVRSKNGGRSWTEVTPLDAPSVVGDPYMHLDPATGRVFVAELKPDLCYQVSFSDDAGDSWVTNPSVCGLTDHENLFTAPPVRSPTVGYPRIVYLCASHVGIGTTAVSNGCLRSLDGGLTFTHAGLPPYPLSDGSSDGGLGQGVGGPDGTLYLPKGWNGLPYLAVSRDEGATWTRHLVADSPFPFEAGPLEPHFSTQASVALDTAGNLYYTWVDARSRPMLAISRDGGERWSKPMVVGPPGLALASLSTVDARRPGAVAIAYMGLSRVTPGWSGYITVSSNALSARPLFYSAPVNPRGDPLVWGSCGVIRCGQAGDFFDVTIGPDGSAWASFVDTCSRKCARGGPNDMSEGVVGRLGP